MKDDRALAYVNLYAILGSLPKLCELDEEARALLAGVHLSLAFDVAGGPCATLVFEDGACRLEDGVRHPTIRLHFSSPAKFNGMIDGTVTPIPTLPGLFHVGFLLKKFTPLTDILTKYLRAGEDDLRDPVFFEKSTTLMLHVIAGAVAQLGNQDPVSRASAGYIVDGEIRLDITGGPSAALTAKDHVLSVTAPTDGYFSYMRFKDMQTARALFDGKINAVVAIGTGDVRVGGMISQVDNVNRILDRVALYLA